MSISVITVIRDGNGISIILINCQALKILNQFDLMTKKSKHHGKFSKEGSLVNRVLAAAFIDYL